MTWTDHTESSPDVEALLQCGRHLANLHSLSPAPDERMRAKIQEILFERGNLECFQRGLLKRNELRDVLLAHMSTLIFLCAGLNEKDCREDPALLQETERALFGTRNL